MKRFTEGMVCMHNISVVLPAYNEEKNIARAVTGCERVLRKLAKEYEIIVVDDGSTDGTGRIIHDLEKKKRVKAIYHGRNIGYGAAIRTGFNNAKYGLVFYTDSDNQFEFEDVDFGPPGS